MKGDMRITLKKEAKKSIFSVEKEKNKQICNSENSLEQVINNFIHIIHKKCDDLPKYLIERIVGM